MPKSEWIEWDAFPDPPKRRKKPIVEILPPEPKPEPKARIRVTIERHRTGPPPWLPIVAAIAVVLLVGSPGLRIVGLLLLALIVTRPELLFAGLIMLAATGFAAWWSRRAGRPF